VRMMRINANVAQKTQLLMMIIRVSMSCESEPEAHLQGENDLHGIFFLFVDAFAQLL
jgi:hypothetical protein